MSPTDSVDGLDGDDVDALDADDIDAFDDAEVPLDRARETLDARDLPPPGPLQETLERLEALDDETVLLQKNDRPPQHLYPQLEERGYAFETVEREDVVLTAIWRP